MPATVNRNNLLQEAHYSYPGAYDFTRSYTLYSITGGPLTGRYAIEESGFRWQGNEGGLRTEWYLLPTSWTGEENDIIERLTDAINAGAVTTIENMLEQDFVPLFVQD